MHGYTLTVTGKPIAAQLADAPWKPPTGQDVIRPWDDPVYQKGHLALLK
ncbi:dihydroxy-acid dehydratase [Geitlerinema sp. CS-897]|nr:dihydroxy-acid dehydratase [Geitlerinema sp. CS-897]